MSKEMELEPAEPKEQAFPGYRDPSLDTIEKVMDGLHAAASVEAVYGAPVKQRDTVVIPAAEVVAFSGFGVGQGYGGSDSQGGSGAGGGGGGGGSAFARPVAVIVISPEGVRVDPVFDMTKIALAGITFAAFTVGMLARLGQMQRKFDRMRKAIE